MLMLMTSTVRNSTTCEAQSQNSCHSHLSLSSFVVSVPGELVTSKRACAGTSTLLMSPSFPGRAQKQRCALVHEMACQEILILTMLLRLVSQSEEEELAGLRDLPLEDPISRESSNVADLIAFDHRIFKDISELHPVHCRAVEGNQGQNIF